MTEQFPQPEKKIEIDEATGQVLTEQEKQEREQKRKESLKNGPDSWREQQ